MDLAHFRMLIHDFLNKDPYIFPEEAPMIILDSKYAVCMANTITQGTFQEEYIL